MSHELRTPLAAILGYAELLGESGNRSGRRDEMVATILRQGRDLSDIVEYLRTRAQSEARTLRVVAVPVDLGANVNQVLESWHGDECMRVTTAGSPARAIGDPARVRQIVRNLVTNALRYGAGAIEITTGMRALARGLGRGRPHLPAGARSHGLRTGAAPQSGTQTRLSL